MSIQYPSVSYPYPYPYPYLAVAQKHNVPYADVLAFIEEVLEQEYVTPWNSSHPHWKQDAALAWLNEQERRRGLDS